MRLEILGIWSSFATASTTWRDSRGSRLFFKVLGLKGVKQQWCFHRKIVLICLLADLGSR